MTKFAALAPRFGGLPAYMLPRKCPMRWFITMVKSILLASHDAGLSVESNGIHKLVGSELLFIDNKF